MKQQQYPTLLEGKMGLKAVIQTLLTDGLLESCALKHNTPILPV